MVLIKCDLLFCAAHLNPHPMFQYIGQPRKAPYFVNIVCGISHWELVRIITNALGPIRRLPFPSELMDVARRGSLK